MYVNPKHMFNLAGKYVDGGASRKPADERIRHEWGQEAKAQNSHQQLEKRQ